MSLSDLNLPENTPWYAAFVAAAAGAALTLLRPFFRWAEQVYEKRSDRLHELRKARTREAAPTAPGGDRRFRGRGERGPGGGFGAGLRDRFLCRDRGVLASPRSLRPGARERQLGELRGFDAHRVRRFAGHRGLDPSRTVVAAGPGGRARPVFRVSRRPAGSLGSVRRLHPRGTHDPDDEAGAYAVTL